MTDRTNMAMGGLVSDASTLFESYIKENKTWRYKHPCNAKRKGDINYTYWNTYTNPRRSPLQEIADTVRKMEKIGYDNAKRAIKIFRKQMR